MAPSCDRLRFEMKRWDNGGATLYAYDGRKRVGTSGTRTTDGVYGKHDIAVVGTMHVEPGYRRCGIATRMYQMLQRESCKHQRRLSSDASRTVASEKFWKKQFKKKRARCIRKGGIAKKLAPDMMPAGTWPCHHYEMKEACPREFDLGRRR